MNQSPDDVTCCVCSIDTAVYYLGHALCGTCFGIMSFLVRAWSDGARLSDSARLIEATLLLRSMTDRSAFPPSRITLYK